jgi:hypothetical protein
MPIVVCWCRLGKRVLDSISPEERLMRGVPKNISKVIIHHPSQVSPELIMEQMQTMTKSYGLKAVGRAAAATVMLPLAVGVDLVILPGPQVCSQICSSLASSSIVRVPLTAGRRAAAAIAMLPSKCWGGSAFFHDSARTAGRDMAA